MIGVGRTNKISGATISVIIPTYQREEAIGRAIASVLAQRGIGNNKIEIVIVDDGGSDRTAEVVEKLVAPSPHRILYQKIDHIGQPGLVRNYGISICTGQFIGYCDSDDIWLPHHLATCLRQFELYPDTLMVETWWSFQIREKSLNRWKIEYQKASTDGRTTTTNSRLHRRMALDRAGLFGTLRWGEDIDLWTRIGFVGPVRRVKVPTSAHTYTRGGNNITFEFCPDILAAYDGQPTPPEVAPALIQLNLEAPQPLINVAVDADWYLSQYPDVRRAIEAGVTQSAQSHYDTFGANEFRLPWRPRFDEAWYRTSYPDLDGWLSGPDCDALSHFVNFGFREGRKPSAQGFAPERPPLGFEAAHIVVDKEWYLSRYPDVARAIENGEFASAQQHYRKLGFNEGRLPWRPLIDEAWYRTTYPDIDSANLQEHFASFGFSEGRKPSPQGYSGKVMIQKRNVLFMLVRRAARRLLPMSIKKNLLLRRLAARAK